VDDRRYAGLDLVYIPERPEAGVRDFFIQRKLVTNHDYAKFVDDGGYEKERTDIWDAEAKTKLPTFTDTDGRPGPRGWRSTSPHGARWIGASDDPVRGITIEEARAYARWSTRQHGAVRFRLPTAAEWEVAAGYDPRAERTHEYPWGDAFDSSWVTCAAKEPPHSGKGMKGRSPLGLLDVTGSVRQWVELKDGAFGTKGSDFAAEEDEARALALVVRTERPPLVDRDFVESAGRALLLRTGFRLVVEH
jgi:iron(II)-dependent oxidoreductase